MSSTGLLGVLAMLQLGAAVLPNRHQNLSDPFAWAGSAEDPLFALRHAFQQEDRGAFFGGDHAPIKKHDYLGGWEGGPPILALIPATQSIKKGKEAKSLFILMAPLILLALFGPILATQAMLPWLAGGGGLTSVNSVAGGRKRRSHDSRLRLLAEYGADSSERTPAALFLRSVLDSPRVPPLFKARLTKRRDRCRHHPCPTLDRPSRP